MAKTALDLIINTLFDEGANLWSSMPPPPEEYSLGVPHPANFFGYDPLTIQRPSDPAEWPSAENPLFYYIDNSDINATDVDNTYGFPDKPRLTVPEGTFPAGTVMIVKGTGYTIAGDGRWQMTFQGTQANPCFFVCEDVTDTTFLKEIRDLSSTYTIYDNLHFTESDQTWNTQAGSQYIILRNSRFQGPGVNVGNSSVVFCNGADDANRTQYVVWYNNLTHDFGDDTASTQNDYHAYLPGEYSSNVWCINNESFRNGGDSIQVGQANYTGLQRPDNIYISKNRFYNDRENAVDIKGSVDIIISENECSGYVPQSSSSGEVIIIHDANEYVWVLNNKLYDGAIGISATGGQNLFILGNEIRDLSGSVDFGAPYFELNTAVYISSHSGALSISHNTIHNSIIGTALNSPTPTDTNVFGNIFGERQNVAQGWDFMISNAASIGNASADFNLHDGFRNRLSSTDYEDLPSWRTATGLDANSIEADPLFTDELNNDFTLQAGSPALGLVATQDPAYSLFQTRYSRDIARDINGNDIPATGADAGAYQRGV